MVKIDDDTQKALLLFNRRSEAADAAKTAERNLEKATKAKDEAAAALKQVQGGGAEAVSAAEAEWRSAVDTWQRLRDGEELPEEAPADEETPTDDAPAEEDTPTDDAPAEEDTPTDDAPAEEDAPVDEAPADEETPTDDAPAEEDAPVDEAPAEEDAGTDDNPAGEDAPADEEE
jgi:hypothetical protein